jgi:hypothetical protein
VAVTRVCNAATATRSNRMALVLQSHGYVEKALAMTLDSLDHSIVLRAMVVMARRSSSEYLIFSASICNDS